MSATSTATITIYVKTMNGQILTIQAPVSVTRDEFYHLLHQAMDAEDRPDVAFLRVFNAEGIAPSVFTDGDVLSLLVEKPSCRIKMLLRDVAEIESPAGRAHRMMFRGIQQLELDEEEEEEGPRNMELYSLDISLNETEIIRLEFYTPVYFPYQTEDKTKRYTDAYYLTRDVEVVQSSDEYIVSVYPDAKRVTCPSHLLEGRITPRYLPYLQKKVHVAWMKRVASTGNPVLIPV
jgi:hypothetical protein